MTRQILELCELHGTLVTRVLKISLLVNSDQVLGKD